MDLENRDLETLYASAYHCYEWGTYRKAAEIFTRLVMADPFQGRFWKGLAASKQMLKEYRAALRAWGVLALLKGDKPDSHFHAAECYLSVGEEGEALKALTLAQTRANPSSDFNGKITQLKEGLTHVS